MRWRDDKGARWKLKPRRLAWFRRVNPGIAFDLFPAGLGQDPISLVIALPGLIAVTVMSALWLVEFVPRLLLAPFAAALRLTGLLPYRIDLYRNGEPVGPPRLARGLAERRRVISELRP